VDGNKPIGHGAMEVFLLLNGYEIDASVDEQESEEYQISDFVRVVWWKRQME
jgi:death-on-curing protein